MHVICKHYAMLLDNVTMFVEFRLIAINGTISNAHQGHTFIGLCSWNHISLLGLGCEFLFTFDSSIFMNFTGILVEIYKLCKQNLEKF